MPLPSLIPAPLFKRGFSTLALVPRSRAGNTFSIKVKDGVTGHYQQFSVGDILRAKVFNGTTLIDNWLRVDGIVNPGASAGYYAYTVTRMSGTAGLIPAGTAIVNYGPSGSSFISLSSDGAIGAAPNITIGKHSGTPWLSSTTLVRLGNLNGEYGVTSNLYGFGVGDYSGGNYLRYDPTNGFLLKAGNGDVSISSTGIVLNGDQGNSAGSVTWSGSSYNVGSVYSVSSASAVGSVLLAQGKGSTSSDTTASSLNVLNLNGLSYTSATIALTAVANTEVYVNIRENGSGTRGLLTGVLINGSGAPSAMLDVRQSTLGSAVSALASTATNDDPTEWVYQNRGTTTDATVTTLHTFTVATSTTVFLRAEIVARRTGGSGGAADDGASYIVTACVKGASGTAALIGSATTTAVGESQPAWDATIDVTSNTARVRVTGAANNNITWHVTLRAWQVSS